MFTAMLRSPGAMLNAVIGALSAAWCLDASAAPPAFSNQTAAAGVSAFHLTSGFAQSNYAAGGTVGDFNRDGFIDLFLISGGGGNPAAPDRLFINNGDGTFTNSAAAWGLTATHKGKGATTGDFNNDGWLDLYVTSAGPAASAAPGHHKLYRNNGNGTFTDVAASAGVHVTNPATEDSWSACFGDYDLDGDLDLFVGGFRTAAPSNIGNRLFRNNGNETFTDVTAAIGLFNGVGPVACLSCSFADMDGDKYPELLLGGDFKNAGFVGSRYFKNNGNGTFSDITNASNTGDEENGMGQTLGDLNNDQRLDWYVTSIYLPSVGWSGNKLYRNLGNHQFVEYGGSAGCADGGYGWGAVAADFNHDGWTDLAETNGDGSSGGTFFNEQSYLWMNNANGTFTEQALPAGFSHFGKGRCLIHFDYDNDGDQDMALMSNNQAFFFFRNDLDLSAAGTNWLRVFLDTGKGASTGEPLAPNGYGAKVYATAGGTTQMRSVDGGASFLGVNELSAHFGLGSAAIVDELRVKWAKGDDTVLTNIAVNQTLTLQPPVLAPCAGDVGTGGSGDGVVDVSDLLAVINGWGPCPAPPAACPADVSPPGTGGGDGQVNVSDLLLIINAWGPCP